MTLASTPRRLALGLSGLALAALVGCSSSTTEPTTQPTTTPPITFDTKRMGPLFERAIAQGERLAAAGWRSSGWASGSKTLTRTWCTGGAAGSTQCSALADADGVKASAVYAITAEFRGDDPTSGGLGVTVEYASAEQPAALTMRYRDVSYASADGNGFTATITLPDSQPEKVPGERRLTITETPVYQPAYVDGEGHRHEIGEPIRIGTTILAKDQLLTFTGSANGMRDRMLKRIGSLYDEARTKLKYKNTPAGVCAIDGQPNCPPAKLTNAERQTALDDLDRWYNTYRRLLRAQATAVVKSFNTPIDWSTLREPDPKATSATRS